MALSIEKVMENYEDGSPVTVSYHRISDIAYEVPSNSTGITIRSYVDGADFVARGWNNPRAGTSFFYANTAPNSAIVDFCEKAIIAKSSAWSTATQVP